jgi:hypothetical protein
MSKEVSVAVIAACAAIGGALAGGVASYLGDRAIVNKQINREERQQKIAALGVARVYAEQVGGAAEVLKDDSAEDRWPGQNDLSYFDLPALEDRRLVQARLPAKSATRVSEADQVMRAVGTIIDVEPGHELSVHSRRLIVTDRQTLERGAVALRELGK